MKATLTTLAIIWLALLAPALQTQRFAPLLAIKVGAIRNWQQHSFNPQSAYSFYPELELAHKLFALQHDSLLFSLAVYGSVWDDGVEQTARNCSDCITYSTSAQVLGMRLGVHMAEFPVLPLDFYGGIALRLNMSMVEKSMARSAMTFNGSFIFWRPVRLFAHGSFNAGI